MRSAGSRAYVLLAGRRTGEQAESSLSDPLLSSLLDSSNVLVSKCLQPLVIARTLLLVGWNCTLDAASAAEGRGFGLSCIWPGSGIKSIPCDAWKLLTLGLDWA